MNVHVRLFAASALASLATLALAGAPLAAQSAQFGSDTGASAFAAVGGVILMFWRKIVGAVRLTFQVFKQKLAKR